MTKNKDWRSADPNSKREASRYQHPIPSREMILEFLGKHGVPVDFSELADELGLSRHRDLQALGKRLKAMSRDGQIIVNRRQEYCLLQRIPLITGTVIGHRDGFGFVRPDTDGKDIYLGARQMREVMHGDHVAVRIKGYDRRDRPEGSLVEVLEHRTAEVVGRFHRESGVSFVVPDNPRLAQHLLVPPRQTARARPGQIVVAEIDEYPSASSQAVGHIVEVLGEQDAPGLETEIAIRAHDLPWKWPRKVKGQARELGSTVPATAKKGREDLRDLPLVTIDGADAKDFDDAVYCEKRGQGWRVIVAIADVAYYVRPGTPLDVEARLRGTSVYFPNRVIPMLPEELSNGLCSLNPKVDRLCTACEMHVSPEGKVTRSRFLKGVMKSAARLTYSQVYSIISGKQSKIRQKLQAVLPQIENLYDVYRAFAKARRHRGTVDLDIPEIRFVFDAEQKIESIVEYRRNDAHRLIEECMIAANVEAAQFLKKNKLPTLYRVHDAPDPDRAEELRVFLATLGISLPPVKKLEARHYSKILGQIAGRPDEILIETVLLRSMAQAKYQPVNIGHFGLALPMYAHFTSPIRRYPDLLVHRAIHHLLDGGRAGNFDYGQSDMEKLGRHTSECERRADDATREAMDYLKCEYLLDRIGEEFDALVTGVTDFGLFVQIPQMQIDGLVHVSSLRSDYYHHDAAQHRLVGESTNHVYRLTDNIRVRLTNVDMENRKIDFEPADARPASQQGKPSKPRKRKRQP